MTEKPVPLCNFCGESCACEHEYGSMGLHGAVSGGYCSTPGNGCGALDDCTSYKFSLCEFCLDWLFTQFRVPPTVAVTNDDDRPEPFRPAEQRVREDEWRQRKEQFLAERQRRALLRERRT